MEGWQLALIGGALLVVFGTLPELVRIVKHRRHYARVEKEGKLRAEVTLQTPYFLQCGQEAHVLGFVVNRGSETWSRDPSTYVALGICERTWRGRRKVSKFRIHRDGVGVENGDRVIIRADENIGPGCRCDLIFSIQAPYRPGTYRLEFQMVKEGVTWFGSKQVSCIVVCC